MNRKDLILSRENAKRFSLGNVSETMSDKKLKSVLGGYGGYAECCQCTWDEWSVDYGNFIRSTKGTICGYEGDPNCSYGKDNFRDKMYAAGIDVIDLNCN